MVNAKCFLFFLNQNYFSPLKQGRRGWTMYVSRGNTKDYELTSLDGVTGLTEISSTVVDYEHNSCCSALNKDN